MVAVHDLGVIELAAACGQEVSPIEVVDAYLDRIDRWNDTVGAYVTVTGDRARAEALRAEQAIQRGADDLPPLLGVPIPIKDLTRVAGVRCTYVGRRGLRRLGAGRRRRGRGTAAGAGTVLLGKTSTPEFGSPCYTEPDVAPPSRTPYDLSRIGGRVQRWRSGCGGRGWRQPRTEVTVAGRVRIPASGCGLVGLQAVPRTSQLRTAFGRRERPAHRRRAAPARVADAAALLDAMAGP